MPEPGTVERGFPYPPANLAILSWPRNKIPMNKNITTRAIYSRCLHNEKLPQVYITLGIQTMRFIFLSHVSMTYFPGRNCNCALVKRCLACNMGPRNNYDQDRASSLTFWGRNFFLILAHPVYKMWIIQEPNTLQLWNKLYFEEKKTESIYRV